MSAELDDFLKELRKEQLDEKDAYSEYAGLAAKARSLGLPNYMVTDLEDIALDEDRHGNTLKSMITILESTATTQQPSLSERPFPSSTEDWQRLADDISIKDPSMKRTVDDAMIEIRSNTQYAKGSQMQLTSLAGKLGIK